MKILLTGGCGFVGHHFIEHAIKNTTAEIVIFDKLTYAASGFDRLRDINCFEEKRIKQFVLDFSQPISVGVIDETRDVTHIVHMGAETHVDRSIEDAEPFVISNILGTLRMLDYARKLPRLKKFIMFSTDEVFGPAPEGILFKETDAYNCTNPYSATKAGAEQLARSYANTHGVPVIITNTMNVFGERQHPEKFIPLCVKKILSQEKIFIHSDPTRTIPGSRFWIHARNVADAVFYILFYAEPFDRFNIVGEKEVDNLDMAKLIAEILGKQLDYALTDFHSSRPGHDLRYALDGSKLKNFGWDIPMGFEESLHKTIEWMIEPANTKWLKLT
jgi:dTDP-glucose 4,6-dehydratase